MHPVIAEIEVYDPVNRRWMPASWDWEGMMILVSHGHAKPTDRIRIRPGRGIHNRLYKLVLKVCERRGYRYHEDWPKEDR
jgi:hypothetical protein